MESFYRTDEWKINEMSPEELLKAHDSISRQIVRLKEHWTHLNEAQTKIMTRFYEIEEEKESKS